MMINNETFFTIAMLGTMQQPAPPVPASPEKTKAAVYIEPAPQPAVGLVQAIKDGRMASADCQLSLLQETLDKDTLTTALLSTSITDGSALHWAANSNACPIAHRLLTAVSSPALLASVPLGDSQATPLHWALR